MYIGVLIACVRVSDLPRTGITDSCELTGGYWELNPSPLQEQSVFLTSETSLQPSILIFDFETKLPTWSLTHTVARTGLELTL